MATAHGSTTHLPTGSTAATATITADEVHEFERILKISDQIFAGSHPRLRVPQQFVRKPTARNGQNSSASIPALKNKPSSTLTENNTPNETPVQSPHRSQGPAAGDQSYAATRIAPKPTSEIDPIFLTKSDDLVRAELQLQRQRLERTLRDQAEQQKHELKHKLAAQDTKPDFNVSQVLTCALQIARPISMTEPSEANGPSDSFDENSFYSSRAPDSTPPPEEQQRPSSVVLAQAPGTGTGANAGTVTQVPREPYADELQRLEALNKTGSDQEMHDAYPVADQHASYSQKQPIPGRHETAHLPQETQQIDALEEPEYSPPAPIAPPLNHSAYQPSVASGVPRPRYTEQTRFAQETTSPSQNVKVVRNHITSPAAPRPSRVSPLATAKVPSVQQLREERAEHESDRIYSDPDSARGSPNGPASHIVSRKRRRLQERREDSQPLSRRRDADPSETYIKEEPVSPPPFEDDPAIIRNRPAEEQPVYIDIASPQYTPVPERQERPAPRPIYESRHYHEVPVDQGPPRIVSSRMSTRRPIRDDGDLRRVASMQYASRSEYPREYLPVDPNSNRAASYSVMDRQPEHPHYYEEVPRSYGPRYVAVDDMPQSVYREPYYEELPPQRVIAAPRRRIVDENGIEYEEVIPAHRLQPMAPPPRPVSKVPRVETFDDRPSVRAPSVRAPSVAQDQYVERRYVQDMAPPQYYRRIPTEYGRPISNERRAYEVPLEAHEPYPRSGSVQVAEYVPRHSTYVDEHAAPPERVMRTASVRPQLARYEEPREIPQHRVGSIRPGPSRDVSVIMDERLMGDYIERPYYVRERRFYDGEDGSRVALDSTADSVPRVSRHY